MEDYKQKYEIAIKQAKKELRTCGNLDCDAARQIFRFFPELKESEDEKVRKWLIDWANTVHWSEQFSVTKEQVLAWLEKQGEQKLIDKIQLGKKYKCIASPRYSTFMIGEIYKPEDKFLCSLMNFCSDCFELIEDGDQKITDKVEPKFKVGDTIVEKDLDEYDYETIKDIKDERYIFTDGYCMNIDEQEGWQLVKTTVNKEQKSAWSEEDEQMFILCASSVKTRYNDGLLTCNEYEQASLWLKSLKERMKGE